MTARLEYTLIMKRPLSPEEVEKVDGIADRATGQLVRSILPGSFPAEDVEDTGWIPGEITISAIVCEEEGDYRAGYMQPILRLVDMGLVPASLLRIEDELWFGAAEADDILIVKNLIDGFAYPEFEPRQIISSRALQQLMGRRFRRAYVMPDAYDVPRSEQFFYSLNVSARLSGNGAEAIVPVEQLHGDVMKKLYGES